MLESLTKEQLLLVEETRKFWIERTRGFESTLTVENAREAIDMIYALVKLPPPLLFIADSPTHAQRIANAVKVIADRGDVVTFDNVTSAQAHTQVTVRFTDNLAVNITDLGWVSFYNYFEKINVIRNREFALIRSLLERGVYVMITLEGACVVVKSPRFMRGEVNDAGENVRLHSEDKFAVEFADGTGLTFWRGVEVPKSWIFSPGSLKKNDIKSEANAELRRCLMEILGAKKYYDVLTDGNGLALLDEDTDHQGNIMRLFETKKPDEITGAKIQFLECVDPSTGRVYNIYPPKQNAKNVWEAKAQTFGNAKLFARQGDVGLTKVGATPDRPVIET